MADQRTSIHGRKFGLDGDGNAVIGDGNSVFASNNASTRGPRIATGAINTAPTTATGLVAYGYHFLTSAQGTYLLDDPVPGQEVVIFTESQTTAAARIVKTSTANGVTFGSSGGYNSWNSTAAHTLRLVGKTTTQYNVISNALASTVSTSYPVFSTI
jgi:hypothetical protein